MLKVFDRYEDMDFRQLMDVYVQWNCDYGKNQYSRHSENLQMLYAEQDFYDFLISFFLNENARYFVWAPQKRYTAALRVQPYMDGLLLEALETAPDDRRKGYATDLVKATISYYSIQKPWTIYSHIRKSNKESLSVHYKCGFSVISNDAVFLDGTYHKDAYTLVYKYNPAD